MDCLFAELEYVPNYRRGIDFIVVRNHTERARVHIDVGWPRKANKRTSTAVRSDQHDVQELQQSHPPIWVSLRVDERAEQVDAYLPVEVSKCRRMDHLLRLI
jgi:hypothetical protein